MIDERDTTRVPDRRMGPRREHETPYLVGIAGEQAGSLVSLADRDQLVVGRLAGSDLRLLDDSLSRRHARIFRRDEQFYVEDLGSSGGTFLNGVEVSRATVLRRGDRIHVGESNVFKLDWLTPEEIARWQSASLDPLTECFNRAVLDTRAPEMFERARGRGRSLAVAIVDIDHFKMVNDTLGHHAGDFVLLQVASLMTAWLGEHAATATLYRQGGEEFAVLMPDIPHASAVTLAEGLRTAIDEARWMLEERPLHVSVSIGVATLDPGTSDIERHDELFRLADERLYRAKNTGRNKVVAD